MRGGRLRCTFTVTYANDQGFFDFFLAACIATLSSQGFSSDGWFGKRMAFRHQHGGFRGCDFTASVSWDSDSQSRISAIDARPLRSPGCT
jgi:hypothetical protein